jgi:alpha,alpha-trehalase
MNAQPYDAAILDMDGVITRTAKLHARAWKQMFDAYLEGRGRREARTYEPFDADADYRRYVDGKTRFDGVRSFLDARSIRLPEGDPGDPPGKETVCGLGNRKDELFHELLREGVEAYDDTIEQIGNWKKNGMKVAVISASRNCTEILKAAGVFDLFDATLDGNDLNRLHLKGKPAPDIFLRAATELGVSPERAIVVEDSLAGVQAGRAGGFGLVVGVARKGNLDELLRHGAGVAVYDLRELKRSAGTACPEARCLRTP